VTLPATPVARSRSFAAEGAQQHQRHVFLDSGLARAVHLVLDLDLQLHLGLLVHGHAGLAHPDDSGLADAPVVLIRWASA
jgi:hypothetical protein